METGPSPKISRQEGKENGKAHEPARKRSLAPVLARPGEGGPVPAPSISPMRQPVYGKPRRISPHAEIVVSVDTYTGEGDTLSIDDMVFCTTISQRPGTPIKRTPSRKTSPAPSLASTPENSTAAASPHRAALGEAASPGNRRAHLQIPDPDQVMADRQGDSNPDGTSEPGTGAAPPADVRMESEVKSRKISTKSVKSVKSLMSVTEGRPSPAQSAGSSPATALKTVGTSPGRLETLALAEEEEEARDKVDDFPSKPRFKRTATMVSTAMMLAMGSNNTIQPTISPTPPLKSRNSFRKKAAMIGKVATASSKVKGRAGLTENSMVTIDTCKLYELLRPLFVLMKIAGIFFIRPQGEALFRRKGLFKHVTGQTVYCVVITAVMSVNWLRSVLSFSNSEKFGYVLFFKLLWCIFWYECASRSLFSNIMWWKTKGGLQDLFITIERSCYADGIVPYESALKSTMYWVLAGVAFGCSSITAVFAWGFFGPENLQILFNTVIVPVPPDMHYIAAYKGALLVVIIWSVIVAGLSLAFYSVVCFILYKEFEYFCRTFNMKLGPNGDFEDDLQRFRITHQNKSLLVQQADGCFKYYVANTYMSNSPLVCLLLYNLLDTQQDFLYRLMGMYWVAIVLTQTVVVSVAAIMINTQAHAPVSTVHAIRTGDSSPERQLEISMFLNKLTATDIGLSAWDMFVVNKPTMLTIAGMILTYFFLLVQFRNPLQNEDELSTDCSCTLLDTLNKNISAGYNLQQH